MRSKRGIGVICCVSLLCGLLGWKAYRFWAHSRSWLQTAETYRVKAEHGDANAEYELGMMYFHGTGVAQDYPAAFRWIRKAADQGLPKAETAVGYFFNRGLVVRQSYSEAVRWYSSAAAKGDAVGEFDLGYMLRHGLGVPQDDQQARRLIGQSANLGNASAECELAYMYRKGYGVPQNYAQAAYWYRKAADQGNALAESGLGYLEFYGYGVQENRREADQWFHKAAEQGDQYARDSLGIVLLGMTKFQLTVFLIQLAGGFLLLIGALFSQRKRAQPRRNELWAACLCLVCAGIWWFGYNHHSVRASTGTFIAYTSVEYTLGGITIGLLVKIVRGGAREGLGHKPR